MAGKAQLLQRLEKLEQTTAKRSKLEDFYKAAAGELLCEKYAMFAALYDPMHEDYQ